MSDRTKRALARFGKALASVIIAGLAAKYGDNEIYLAISPLILAVDKYLRDK